MSGLTLSWRIRLLLLLGVAAAALVALLVPSGHLAAKAPGLDPTSNTECERTLKQARSRTSICSAPCRVDIDGCDWNNVAVDCTSEVPSR